MIFGINWLAMMSLVAIVTWWSGDFSMLKEGAIIAVVAAAAITARLSWGWTDKRAGEAVWRYRSLQAGAIWGAVFVVLGFVLLRTK
jgi:hypothetical protein